MLTVVTVLKSNGEYEPKHLPPLVRAIKKHISIPVRFVCLSDIQFEIEGVERYDLPCPWKGWWSKINLFHPSVLAQFSPFLYLDLDTIVVGDLAPFYGLPKFTALRDFWIYRTINSSIMYFPKNSSIHRQLAIVFDKMEENPAKAMRSFRGDQNFVHSILTDYDFVQVKLPDFVFDFKPYPRDQKTFLTHLPSCAKIVHFHGKPRPWSAEALSIDWVARYWQGKSVFLRDSFRVPLVYRLKCWVSVLVPSWGRPHQVLSLLQSIEETVGEKESVELLVGVNEDDPKLRAYQAISGIRLFEYPKDMSICQIWNELALEAKGRYLMMGNDDMRFRTDEWVEIFKEKIKRFPDELFVAFFEDGRQEGRTRKDPPNFPIVSRSWINLVEAFAEERFMYSYPDTWVYDLGKRAKRLLPIPEVYCEHLHFTEGKSEKDETYSKTRDTVEAKAIRRSDRHKYISSVSEREALAHKIVSAVATLNREQKQT